MINHITHLEDLVLVEGSVGGMKIQNLLWAIQTGQADITTKWDGAPSIFAGWQEDRFFVSTKSYLNKTPVTYDMTTIEQADISIGLKQKLRWCLRLLPDVVPKGLVLQGDLIFTPGELFASPQQPDYFLAHPNTLVYGFPNKWKGDWDLGVVWHSWISRSGEVSKPRFGNLLTTKKVLSIDPIIKSYSIDGDVSEAARTTLAAIDHDWLDDFIATPKATEYLQRSVNSFVRAGIELSHGSNWEGEICNLMRKDLDKLTTDAGKERRQQTVNAPILAYTKDEKQMNNLLAFFKAAQAAKSSVINSLEKHSKVATWVLKDNGLVSTAHEGYVVIGHSESIKLVDRAQFSHFNFSPDISRGWDASTRT